MENKESKKNHFKRLKESLKSRGKATAELDASKNPQKFMEQNKNPSIKNNKGVAF